MMQMTHRSQRDPSAGRANLPPEDLMTVDAVRIAAAHLKEMRAQLRTVSLQFDALIEQRATAESSDRQALADALRARKRDPGSKALDDLRSNIAEAERQLDARTVAVSDAFAEYSTVVETHRNAWTAQLEKQITTHDQRRNKLLDELADNLDRTSLLRTTLGYAERFPQQTSWKPGSSYVAGLTRPSGDPYRAHDVVAELRQMYQGST